MNVHLHEFRLITDGDLKKVELEDDGSVPHFQAVADVVDSYFCPHAEVRHVNPGIPDLRGVVATQPLPPGTVLFIDSNRILRRRSRTTVQVSKTLHMEPTRFGQYVNHSCSPNAAVRVLTDGDGFPLAMVLVLFEAVGADGEITFDYASTEAALTLKAQRTPCACGSSACRGTLMGYNQLTAAQREELIRKNLPTTYTLDLHRRRRARGSQPEE